MGKMVIDLCHRKHTDGKRVGTLFLLIKDDQHP